MRNPLDVIQDRYRAEIENHTNWTTYRIDICMNHLMAALTSNQGQFIVVGVGKITCGTWESADELFLHSEVTVKVGPSFEKVRGATFTFKTDGPKYRGLLTPHKQGDTESNHRDRKCKRTNERPSLRSFKRTMALIDVEELFA